MTNPRIIIVGPGAMGCGVAALLGDAGADVALLDYRHERAAQIQRQGIRVEREGRAWTARVPCAAGPEALGPARLIIILVKAYATAEAARHASPCVAPDTAVLTLQNGLGNHEAIAESVAVNQVLAGTIVMGCASSGVAQVLISGVGDIVIGSPAGNAALAEAAAEILAQYWPQVSVEADIEAALWRKVTVNAAINPLTALTGLPNGALIEDPDLHVVLGAIAREAAAVAEAMGVRAFADADPAGLARGGLPGHGR